MNLLEVESFSDTFGSKSKRKRPKIGGAASLEALVQTAQDKTDKYEPAKDPNMLSREWVVEDEKNSQHLFEKGQSKRIWGELYKVIDCSDVVIQVLDARDPQGTRSR